MTTSAANEDSTTQALNAVLIDEFRCALE